MSSVITQPSSQKERAALTPSTIERGVAASIHGVERVTLCADNHRALKSSEASWQAARFGGYQPLGAQLGEQRCCPVCESSMVRLISFRTALSELLDHLLAGHQPDEAYVHSASMLVEWAQRNLPGQLGIASDQRSPAEIIGPAAAGGDGEIQQLGQELRRRRECAGLSRSQLSRLSGVADSTIRNYERGRHRPTYRTIQRVSSVSALRLGSVSIEPLLRAQDSLHHVNPC